MKQGTPAVTSIRAKKARACHAAALVQLQAQALLALSRMMLACPGLQINTDMCTQDQPGFVVCPGATMITNNITVCSTCFLLLQKGSLRISLVHVCCGRELSWEAATERMLDAAEMGPGDWPKAATKVAEATLFSAYNAALGTPGSVLVMLSIREEHCTESTQEQIVGM